MRQSGWTPSIVANDQDQTVYLVADDFGKNGRAWRETDYETSDLETVIQDLLTGQYSNPIRVVAFNTAERWSEDVSGDVAHELCERTQSERHIGERVGPPGHPDVHQHIDQQERGVHHVT